MNNVFSHKLQHHILNNFSIGILYALTVGNFIGTSLEAADSPAPSINQVSIMESGMNIVVDIDHKLLINVLNDIQKSFGIEFTLPTMIRNDSISKKIIENSWHEAVKTLLSDYNYIIVSKPNGEFQKVIVSSRKNNFVEATMKASKFTDNKYIYNIISYNENIRTIPERYKNLDPVSIMSVFISIDRLATMEIGDKISIDLPIGHFNIIYDYNIKNKNSSTTWVCHIEGMDKSNLVVITQGESYTLGQINIAGNYYSIDYEDGQNWLVNVHGNMLSPIHQGISNFSGVL